MSVTECACMFIHAHMCVLILHCRLLKKLREKDSHQIELEKREQGFALYLNGANLSHRSSRHHPQAPPTRKSKRTIADDGKQSDRKRPSKTAGQYSVLVDEVCAFSYVDLNLCQTQVMWLLVMGERVMEAAEQRQLLQRERVGHSTPLN